MESGGATYRSGQGAGPRTSHTPTCDVQRGRRKVMGSCMALIWMQSLVQFGCGARGGCVRALS